MSIKGSNLSIVKKKNSQLIREILYDNSPISRTEIAQRIALSLPTVTTNIAKLIADGAVLELSSPQEGDSKQLGRRPVMLDYSPDYRYYIGVDLSPYWTYLVITDLRGRILFQKRNDLISTQYSSMLNTLQNVIFENLREANLEKERILGVGICLPGFIDADQGIVHNNMRKAWNGHRLAADLEQLVGIPVHIENNVRARAIGFGLFHKNQSESPLLYYFISHGVGCSLVLDREVLYGASAGAGEIGHMVVDPNGPVCATCGNRGCLEAVASESAIVRQCKNIMNSGIPTIIKAISPDLENLLITDVLTAQSCKDSVAANVVNEAVRHIGLNIANLANFISPQSIVVDSNLFTYEENQSAVMEIIRNNTFSYQNKRMDITFLPHNSYSGAIGAAATAVKTFFLENTDN